MKAKVLILVLVAAFAAAVWFFGLPAANQSQAPRGVVFVTIDTLRADHLESYGYPRPTSPFLASLSDQGLLFTDVFSASSHTAPSHASMFTGVFPFQHGLLANGARLNPEILTAAKALKAKGFKTAGFSAVAFMENVFAFDPVRDVSSVKEPRAEGKVRKKNASAKRFYRPAERQVSRVLKWLEKVGASDKFFIWLHFYDVHQWTVDEFLPPEYPAKFAALPQEGFFEFLRERHGVPAEALKDKGRVLRMMNNYDGRLLFVDRQLERLYRYMEDGGYNDNTLWMVTSDHGEGLGNHNYDGHGEKVYQEQLHVPLIIHWPGRPEKRVLGELVRTVDFFSTFLDLAGYEPADLSGLSIQGASLLPLIGNEACGEWPVKQAFAQRRPKDLHKVRTGWEGGDVFTLQDRRYKYIFHSESQDEFFDLRKDPFELQNMIGQEPQALQSKMLGRLKKMVEELPRVDGKYESPELNPETFKELQALGYL